MKIAIGATNINDIKLGTNQITKAYMGSVQVWEKPSAIPNWFYVEDVSGQANNLLTVTTSYGSNITNLEYSTDAANWSSTRPSIPVNGKVYMRANALAWSSVGTGASTAKIDASKNFNVGGNIMSLFYGSGFTGNETAFPDSTQNVCASMFYHCTRLQSAANLVLPATTLNGSCYTNIFNGCTALTDAPALPATVMTAYCYEGAFTDCSSLTTAPALPATTLAQSCYESLFWGCTSLVNAPATLPATTLDTDVYNQMFRGCTALTTAPEIMATSLTGGAFTNMFYGCSSLSAITIHVNDGVWDGRMDANGWTYGVAASGTFNMPTVMDGVIPTNDVRGIPAGWTVVLT